MRYEMDLARFLAQRIATAAAHIIRADELMSSAKQVMQSTETTAEIAALLGLTDAQATAVQTLVNTAVTNLGTARTDMRKIEAGIDVG